MAALKQERPKLPTTSTALSCFLMHYFDVSDLWWGIYITLMVILWAATIWAIYKVELIDIEDFQLKESTKRKSFMDKMKEKISENN